MDHQDWETFVVHCKEPGKKKQTGSSNIQHHDKSRQQKIDDKEKDGDLKHTLIDKSLSLEIQQARLKKGWTQKQLASRISVIPSVINEMETGKYIYNHIYINKVKKILGIYNPRK